MSFDDAITALVFDFGSGVSKAGFAGDETPSAIFESALEHSSHVSKNDVSIGGKVQFKRNIRKMRYPIENGKVVDWDDMEKLWHHTFYNELRVSPEEHTILITESPITQQNNREKTAEIIFETFGVPGIYMAIDSVLSLYNSGRTSGVVIDFGDTQTRCIPIDDGEVIRHAIKCVDLAGRQITNLLHMMMSANLNQSISHNTTRHIKEKSCYVALDFDEELEATRNNPIFKETYSLPDGESISLCEERFQCCEYLFNPSAIMDPPAIMDPSAIMERETVGLHYALYTSLMKSENDVPHDFFTNIVLSGGTSMLRGLSARLHKELRELTQATRRVKVSSPIDRKFSAWVGGSMLAALPSFKSSWRTRNDYQEYGVSVLDRSRDVLN